MLVYLPLCRVIEKYHNKTKWYKKRFLQGCSAVEFSFIKQRVAGANFAIVSYNICIIKPNMFYIERHLLTMHSNK